MYVYVYNIKVIWRRDNTKQILQIKSSPLHTDVHLGVLQFTKCTCNLVRGEIPNASKKQKATVTSVLYSLELLIPQTQTR